MVSLRYNCLKKLFSTYMTLRGCITFWYCGFSQSPSSHIWAIWVRLSHWQHTKRN